MKYVKKAGYIVATIFFLVFTLGPFVWTFVMAITPKAEMFSNVVRLLPSHITWSNFQNLFSGGRRSVAYFTGLKNSLRAVIVTICIGMPIALQNGVSGKENYQKCLTYYDGHSGNGNYYSSV